MKQLLLKILLTLSLKANAHVNIPHFYHVQVKPFSSTLRIYEDHGMHVIVFAVEEARPWFKAHLNFHINGKGFKDIVLHIKDEAHKTIYVPEIQGHVLDLVKNRMRVFLNSFSMLNPIEYTTFIEDLEKVGLKEKELYDFLLK